MAIIHFKKSVDDMRVSTEGLMYYQPKMTDAEHYNNQKNGCNDDVIREGHKIILCYPKFILISVKFNSRKDTVKALQSLDSSLNCERR